MYGRKDWNQELAKKHSISRPLLHAYELQLQHPVTGQMMVFRAPMAPDMQKVAMTIDPHGPENLPDAFFGRNNDNTVDHAAVVVPPG